VGQQPAGIGPQGLDEDQLGRLGRGAVPPASAVKSLRVPDVHPVRRPIHGAAKTLRVDKGFQQHHPVTEACFPIAGPTPLAQCQNARPQVRNVPRRQDEKAAVVDDQLQAAVAMTEVPTDPAIAHRALEGAGGKAQQGDPFLPPGGDVPESFADLRQSPQVVVLPHQFLVARLVAGPSGPHHDLTQVQGTLPRGSTTETFPVLHRGAYNAARGLSRTNYNGLRLKALGGWNEFTLGVPSLICT